MAAMESLKTALAHNLSATTGPTAADDILLGYAPGSLWIDVTHTRIFICVKNTQGAALWAGVSLYSL